MMMMRMTTPKTPKCSHKRRSESLTRTKMKQKELQHFAHWEPEQLNVLDQLEREQES